MKKSLSVLLSASIAFSAFAGVASAADPVTAQEKFDFLKDKKIFTGINAAGDAGLSQKMTRAQFARVLGLLKGANVDAEPAKQDFTDVPKSHWAYQEVGAAFAANLMVGTGGGKFMPNGNIEVQQLAVALVKALGLTPVDGATVEGSSPYAGPYIKALQDAGFSLPTTYKAHATRELLVTASYDAWAALNVAGKVSVTSAKATDANKVEVVLNKAVDDTKATLSLKRGTATVATTTEWGADKKSATLTLTSTKISDGDYTVTLAGLEASQIGTATATFKGEAEKVTKLEFVTTGDEIAKSNVARIKLRAENQYGKPASFAASAYTVVADSIYNASIKKDSDGNLFVQLDTDVDNVTPGLTMIPLYVYSNDNRVTASKTFKLGFAPFVTKLEIGQTVKYSNGKDALINVGDTVTADVRLFDQYGNPITKSQNLNPTFNSNLSPYTNDVAAATFDDYDGDDEYEVRAALTRKSDASGNFNLNVYAGSATGTVAFKISSSKVATKVDFETYNGTIATGDTNKYVKLIVTDANGDTLTPAEIADNASRINVSATGVAGTVKIITVGPRKGEVILPEITAQARSFVFLSASILSPNANSFETYQIPVAERRAPASLVVDTKPKAKAVLGANSDFKIKVKDQYGDDIGTTANYQVSFDYTKGTSGINVTGAGALDARLNADVTDATYGDLAAINDGMTFDTAAGVYGTATLKATLQKNDNGTWKDISSPVSVSIESINPANVSLSYSLADVASLYAALDSNLLPDAPHNTVRGSVPNKTLALTVKDAAGNEVAYPDNIQSVSSSNPNVVRVDSNNNVGYVLGNKAGEATVTAVVYKANGETTSLSSKVTVKADPVVVDKLSANGDKEVPAGSVTGDLWSGSFMDLKVTDQYGVEYAGADINTYEALVGIRYTVSEVSGATVVINARTGAITSFTDTGAAGVYQFVVTATAPSGKSVSTLVFHN